MLTVLYKIFKEFHVPVGYLCKTQGDQFPIVIRYLHLMLLGLFVSLILWIFVFIDWIITISISKHRKTLEDPNFYNFNKYTIVFYYCEKNIKGGGGSCCLSEYVQV